MARSHPTAKPSVNLASPASAAPRQSRIRRDPPPAVKSKLVVAPEESEQRDAVVGILAFALALFVIIIAFGSYSSWSPAQYTLEMNCDGSGSEC